jgi:hypothetical protein
MNPTNSSVHNPPVRLKPAPLNAIHRRGRPRLALLVQQPGATGDVPDVAGVAVVQSDGGQLAAAAAEGQGLHAAEAIPAAHIASFIMELMQVMVCTAY